MEDSFEAGFCFAIHLFATFPIQVSDEELAARLIEIRDGDRTLSPSPADAIAGLEASTGRALPHSLRASVYRLLGDRASARSKEQAAATHVLNFMGFVDKKA